MINRWIGVGRLTKDSELRFLPNGTGVVSFTVAIGRPFKNKSGERESDFVNVVSFRNAEVVANEVKKGSLVGIDGRIQTRNYDGNDGKKVYVTEVIADSVQFLDKKESKPQQNTAPQTNSAEDNDPFANDGQPINISDDDLPF